MIELPTYQLDDFDFQLPEELIAQFPLPQRSASRLLWMQAQSGILQHLQFMNILNLVSPGDVMVFNDTKVMPARLLGHKMTGGRVECLIERVLSEHAALAHIRASKSPPVGTQLRLSEDLIVTVRGREGGLFWLEFPKENSVIELLERYGKMPLPPYIKREAEVADTERYQTVYAHRLGAVAAPTAGLHFDQDLLLRLKQKGVHLQYVTLHVGAGTFQPLRKQQIEEHQMHAEWIKVSDEVCAAISAARQRGNRVIAVGTTVVRCLETAALSGQLQPTHGETRLFVRPGFQFNVVDSLLTNFHLPKSSLLLLVSAFAGYEMIKKSYDEAIRTSYRFYSYGDAMFIQRS